MSDKVRHDIAIQILREEVERIKSVINFYNERRTKYRVDTDLIHKMKTDLGNLERSMKFLVDETWCSEK
jgi:hypothetical protein